MSDIRSRIFSHRKEFNDNDLNEEELNRNPLQQFETWLQEALDLEIAEPYAFNLSTLAIDGFPTARIVYLREVLDEGLVFYTNYTSAKGEEIAADDRASYTFFWNELHRQVRVKGRLQKVEAERSDRYFASRPRASQLGAWASNQSSPLESREVLQSRLLSLAADYEGKVIPRPAHWGGYILIPTEWEFWKGRSSRLHDRFRYTRQAEEWQVERLNP